MRRVIFGSLVVREPRSEQTEGAAARTNQPPHPHTPAQRIRPFRWRTEATSLLYCQSSADTRKAASFWQFAKKFLVRFAFYTSVPSEIAPGDRTDVESVSERQIISSAEADVRRQAPRVAAPTNFRPSPTTGALLDHHSWSMIKSGRSKIPVVAAAINGWEQLIQHQDHHPDNRCNR